MTPPDNETQALMHKARQALEDARLLLAHDRSEAAVNRIYYAAFDAARAALLTQGEAPSSHSIDRRHWRTLAVAEDMRNRADYNAFAVFDVEAATDMLGDVEQLVNAVADLL